MVVAVEEDSTAAVVAADFMVAARQRFMEVEDSAAESTLGLSVDTRTADIMAATTEGGATTTADITAVTAGAAEVTAGVGVIGAADTVTAGAGWRVGFGWPYWGWRYGYPYGYYYSPGYYGSGPYYSYPPYGPSGDPSGSPDQSNGNGNPQSTDPNARPQPNQNGPARYGTPPAQGDILSTDYRSTAAPRARILSSDRVSATPASYQAAASSPAHYATGRATTERGTVEKAGAPLRPEMQKALQRLSEMPPFAREREIETGRYSQFSSAEKQILRNGE